MKTEILNLLLAIPLYYMPDENIEAFARAGNGDKEAPEMLFCFELDEDLYSSFEPDRKKFFSNRIFGGISSPEPAGLELPRGNYLFAQERELLDRDALSDMAAEIQLEGLWQRLKPGKKLYLRYLFEDGKTVSQLFRPLF